MKIAISFLMSLYSFAAFACIDLTGKYQSANSSNSSIYEINQTGCEKFDLYRYDSGQLGYSLNLVTDGNDHLLEEQPNLRAGYRASYGDNKFVLEITVAELSAGNLHSSIIEIFTLDSLTGDLLVTTVVRNSQDEVIEQFEDRFRRIK
jgi:hypothetical protein